VAKPWSSAAFATASITARSAPAPMPSACNPTRTVGSSHSSPGLRRDRFGHRMCSGMIRPCGSSSPGATAASTAGALAAAGNSVVIACRTIGKAEQGGRRPAKKARDPATARRLWELSEELNAGVAAGDGCLRDRGHRRHPARRACARDRDSAALRHWLRRVCAGCVERAVAVRFSPWVQGVVATLRS